jgi:hypothetical protein
MSFVNYEEQLNEIFEEKDEVYKVQQEEGWRIQDLETALWADEIVHQREEKVAEIERVYQERKEKLLAKLDEWKEQTLKPL